MDTTVIKLDLIKILLETEDATLLERVRTILYGRDDERTLSDDDEVIGYEPNGKPLTRKQLLKDIEKAEEAILKGEVIDHDEFYKNINLDLTDPKFDRDEVPER